MFIDCHTHLYEYSHSEIKRVWKRAKRAGVGMAIAAGTTVNDSARAVNLTKQHDGIFAGIGIHPMNIHQVFDEMTYTSLKDMATSNGKVVVVSEIGLDFLNGMPDRSLQYHTFREQIRLAREVKLPIVFHSRSSQEEVLRILREERAYEVGGVMHYFQSDEHIAKKVMDLGFYISLARPLLRSSNLQEVAKIIPIKHIVLETDSAPQRFKTKRENWTEPRHIIDIAEKLSNLKGISIEEVEHITTRNMMNLLTRM